MKKKFLSIFLVCAMTLTMLVGCGSTTEPGTIEDQIKKMSKAQLKSEYVKLYTMYQDTCTKYDDLQTVLNGIQNEEAPSAAIGITGDGTGRFTFYSTDSKIIFPSSFQYPNSEQIAPNGSISIIDGVSVGVGSTWVYKLTGSALELEHSSGISGTIKVSKISSNYSTEILQSDAIEPWFESLPPSQITYSKIFVNKQDYGVQVKTPTLIDSEDAHLTCGMLGFGSYAITYIFVYRGDQDTSKDESINNVINSIQINGNNLLVSDI